MLAQNLEQHTILIMKVFCLNFLALLIAIMSLQISGEVVTDFTLCENDALKARPFYEMDPIRTPNGKSAFKLDFITPTKISYHITLQGDFTRPYFDHYLPVYGLIRNKEYFLLI